MPGGLKTWWMSCGWVKKREMNFSFKHQIWSHTWSENILIDMWGQTGQRDRWWNDLYVVVVSLYRRRAAVILQDWPQQLWPYHVWFFSVCLTKPVSNYTWGDWTLMPDTQNPSTDHSAVRLISADRARRWLPGLRDTSSVILPCMLYCIHSPLYVTLGLVKHMTRWRSISSVEINLEQTGHLKPKNKAKTAREGCFIDIF